jgi:large subunit ribosomal protein L23
MKTQIQLKPVITEKAVMLIESQNILTFKTGKNATKEIVKKEIEKIFKVKISKVRVLVRSNTKYFYVKLKKEFPAIDVATKIGMM